MEPLTMALIIGACKTLQYYGPRMFKSDNSSTSSSSTKSCSSTPSKTSTELKDSSSTHSSTELKD